MILNVTVKAFWMRAIFSKLFEIVNKLGFFLFAVVDRKHPAPYKLIRHSLLKFNMIL